jgi:hypothetical protein
MDATRPRRTRDCARRRWYAGQRQRRFARFMGVVPPCSDDQAGRDGLLAAPQQTRRVIHRPGAPARVVALHSDAHATG